MARVLIVDDSRYQRYLIAQILEGDFIPEHAADGREAVTRYATALAAGTPFDLVVMDILMPELNGHEAVVAIRRLEAEQGLAGAEPVPIVMLSSLDDPGSMLRAQFESGAQAYVTKPFTPATLREALASLGLLDNPLGADIEDCEMACKDC